jgi:hypothetical protein
MSINIIFRSIPCVLFFLIYNANIINAQNKTTRNLKTKQLISNEDILQDCPYKPTLLIFTEGKDFSKVKSPLLNVFESLLETNTSWHYFIYTYDKINSTQDNPRLGVESNKIGHESYYIYSSDENLISKNEDYAEANNVSIRQQAFNTSLYKIEIKDKTHCDKNIQTEFEVLKIVIIEILKKDNSKKKEQPSKSNDSLQYSVLNFSKKLDLLETNLKNYKSNSANSLKKNHLSITPLYLYDSKKSNNKISINSNSNNVTISGIKGMSFGFIFGTSLPISDDSTFKYSVGLGLSYNEIAFSLSANNFNYSIPSTDKDGYKYISSITVNSINENLNLKYLRTPIENSINYSPSKKITLTASLGLGLSYLLNNSSYTANTDITYRGKYDGIKDEFKNMSEYGFIENDSKSHVLSTNNFKKYLFDANIGASVAYSITSVFSLAINYGYAFYRSNLITSKSDNYTPSKSVNDYNAISNAIESLKLNKFNFGISVIYKF